MTKKSELRKEIATAQEAAKGSARKLQEARRRIVRIEKYMYEISKTNAKLQNLVQEKDDKLLEKIYEVRDLKFDMEKCHLHLLGMIRHTNGPLRNYLGDACNILALPLGREKCPYGWKPEDRAYESSETVRAPPPPIKTSVKIVK